MLRFLLICLLLGVSSLGLAAEPQNCPICRGAVIAVEKARDDVSKPSRNLAVWNRSSCGNLLFGPGSMICPNDYYAYSAMVKKWELSLEDSQGFALELDKRICEIPLPDKGKIRSRVVFSQSVDGDAVIHAVAFWCDTDQPYLSRLEEYAKQVGVSISIERKRIPGQSYAKAEVQANLKGGVKNGTPPQPLVTTRDTRPLRLVTPRIIIVDEEEEKMGIVSEP